MTNISGITYADDTTLPSKSSKEVGIQLYLHTYYIMLSLSFLYEFLYVSLKLCLKPAYFKHLELNLILYIKTCSKQNIILIFMVEEFKVSFSKNAHIVLLVVSTIN